MLNSRTQIQAIGLAVVFQTIFVSTLAFAEPNATARIYPRLVMVGTNFQLEVDVGAVGDYSIQEPVWPAVDGVTLINPKATTGYSFKQIGPISEATSQFIAEYQADKAGTYQLGPIEVPLLSSTGEASKVTIDPITVEVYDEAPKPASDIIHSKMPPWWAYFLGIGIIAACAGAVAWWRYRKRKPVEGLGTFAAFPAHMTPEQATLDDIRKLPKPPAADIEAVKAYYDKVDEVLRKYLSIRYNVATNDSTTWEIQQEFLRLRRLDPRAKGVFVIINDCDWVKYARSHPTQNHIDQVPERASQVLMGGIEEGSVRQGTQRN